MLVTAEDLAEHQHGEHKGKDLTKKAGLLVSMENKKKNNWVTTNIIQSHHKVHLGINQSEKENVRLEKILLKISLVS